MTFEWNNAKDWAKVYKGTSIMYEGIASYPDEKIFLSKETLKKCMPELKGRPVIIEHQAGITPENMKEHEVGYVTNCYYNNETGDFDCDFVIDDDTAKDLLDNKGYTLSTSYIAKSFGNSGTFINSKYDREITDLDFRHLAIVKNPRYERVKVYQNEVEEIENGGPGSGDFDHAGRPGLVGGSEPAGTGRGGKYTESGKKHWIGAKPKQGKLFEEKSEIPKVTPIKKVDDKPREKPQYEPEKKEDSNNDFDRILKEKQDESKEKNSIYKKMLTPNVEKQLRDSVKAAFYENPKAKVGDTVIDSDRIISLFSDKLLPKEYTDFSWDKAEDILFDKVKEFEKEIFKTEKSKEKQNDTEKEYNMDKIEVEQGFLNSLIRLVVKQFDNAKKEEKEEDKDLEEVLDEEEKVEDKKEEKEEEQEEKTEEKENKCKNNSVEVDYYELMKEKFNSVEVGADDKIKVVTRETAFENGKKIYG